MAMLVHFNRPIGEGRRRPRASPLQHQTPHITLKKQLINSISQQFKGVVVFRQTDIIKFTISNIVTT